MMNNPLSLFFALALVVCSLVLGIWFWRLRANAILERWASENGYQIMEKTHAIFRFWKIPFSWRWTSGRGQVIYHVVVKDATGKRRAGWVRLGNWFVGLLMDQIDVRWDV